MEECTVDNKYRVEEINTTGLDEWEFVCRRNQSLKRRLLCFIYTFYTTFMHLLKMDWTLWKNTCYWQSYLLVNKNWIIFSCREKTCVDWDLDQIPHICILRMKNIPQYKAQYCNNLNIIYSVPELSKCSKSITECNCRIWKYSCWSFSCLLQFVVKKLLHKNISSSSIAKGRPLCSS